MYINQCPSLSYEDKKAIKDPRKSDLEGQSSTGRPCRLLSPTPASRSSLHQGKRMVRRLCALAEMLWGGRRGAPNKLSLWGTLIGAYVHSQPAGWESERHRHSFPGSRKLKKMPE